MPVLYQNYCYPDVQSVIDVIKTSGQSSNLVSGQYLLNNVEQDNGNLEFDYYILPSFDSFTFTMPIVNCASVGPYVNYTGLTVDDAVELGWLMAVAILCTFAVKLLRRAL